MHLIQAPHLLMVQPATTQTAVTVEEGQVSRTYGVKTPAPVICFTRSAATTIFHTLLYPYADTPPSIQMAVWPVYQQGRRVPADQGTFLQIMFIQGKRHYLDSVQILHDLSAGQYQYQYTRQNLGACKP